MTVQVSSSNVYSAQGVAISVTGIAQVIVAWLSLKSNISSPVIDMLAYPYILTYTLQNMLCTIRDLTRERGHF